MDIAIYILSGAIGLIAALVFKRKKANDHVQHLMSFGEDLEVILPQQQGYLAVSNKRGLLFISRLLPWDAPYAVPLRCVEGIGLQTKTPLAIAFTAKSDPTLWVLPTRIKSPVNMKILYSKDEGGILSAGPAGTDYSYHLLYPGQMKDFRKMCEVINEARIKHLNT